MDNFFNPQRKGTVSPQKEISFHHRKFYMALDVFFSFFGLIVMEGLDGRTLTPPRTRSMFSSG